MNLASVGSYIEFEALSKPEVKNDAIFFEIAPKASACCSKRCCSKGKSIPGDAVFPHEQGIIIRRGKEFFLNNTESVSPPLEAKELPVERDGYTSVLGWALPSRVFKAYEHPWGAILIIEDVLLDYASPVYHGLVLGLLVLPH